MSKKDKDPDVRAEAKESKEEAAIAEPVSSKWIKVSVEELADLQKKGKLMGYRPETKEALIK